MSSNTLQAVQAAGKTSIALAVLATMALTLAVNVAHAHPPWDPPRKVVKVSDLNLNTSEGAAVLYKRIASAAKDVCDVFDDSIFPHYHDAQVNACIDEAITRAVIQVNRPMLTNLYKAKTGKTVSALIAVAESH
jgi:UrcA family protein